MRDKHKNKMGSDDGSAKDLTVHHHHLNDVLNINSKPQELGDVVILTSDVASSSSDDLDENFLTIPK